MWKFVFALVLIPLLISTAEAVTFKGKALGIVISDSCLMSNCLRYKDILQYDSSNPVYAGKFVERNGDLVRTCTSKQNSPNWLHYTKSFVILVDPCLKYLDKIPLVEIYPRLDWYIAPGQTKVVEDKTAPDRAASHDVFYTSKTRYVDATCTNAKITAQNWQYILNDTIQYLQSGCDPTKTTVDTLETHYKQKTQHDIRTSKKYQLEKQYEWIRKNCLKSFSACKEIPPWKG
ncbi:MAG: hypothetical protein ABI337_01580 [Nitrososphaera sp.]|jgi:hypothetical protein